MTNELRDLGWRAFWTFIQAAAGLETAVQAATASGTVDFGALGHAGVIAVGAGVSAVLSLVKTFASNRLGTGTTTRA